MDLDASAPAVVAGGAKRRAVRSKTEEDEDRKYKQLLMTVAKLSLSSALQVRTLRAVTIECFRMEANNRYITAFRDGTAKYEAAIKVRKEKGESAEQIKDAIGIPSVWGANGLFAEFVKDIGEEDNADNKEAQEIKKKIQASIATWGDWRVIHKCLPHARVCKMYSQQQKRLEMAAPMMQLYESEINTVQVYKPGHVWFLLKQRLTGTGAAKEMQGLAPAGDLERRIQEALDAAKEE